jgi:peptide/nickel transport system substrate-binding protein
MRTLSVCICVVALAACTREGARYQVHRADTLVVAVPQEPVSLNPLYLEGPTAYTYAGLMYSYLTNYDSNGDIVGDLARQTPTLANGGISPDGTRITYHLRRGVRWQDGTPVTARDVKFSYDAVMNPNNTVGYRYGYDRVASVRAPDPYTVVVILKRPFSPIIAFFFGGDSNYPILPAHLLSTYPSLDHVAFNSSPVGSGPFELANWYRGDRLELKANDSYYQGRPGLKRVILPFITNDATTINELRTGEVDAAFSVNAAQIVELRSIPNHRIVITPVPYFYGLSFNMEDPVVGDSRVRRAFALAIDRQTMVRKISLGLYDAGTGPRGLFTWAYDPDVKQPPYDPQRAERLLENAGWVAGPGGIRTKNGVPLRVQLAFPAGDDTMTRFGVAIAAAERAIGIEVSTKTYARVQYQAVDGPILQGHYQVALYNYQATYDPDASWLLGCDQRSPGGFNEARYCNPTVDAELQRAASTFDRAERVALYRLVQRQIAADLPYYFVCQISEVDVIPSQLIGYARPLLSPFTSAWRWRWNN